MTRANSPGASRCDRCGETVTDLDAGFSPGLQGMAHDCGGTWRQLELEPCGAGAITSHRCSNAATATVEWMPPQHRESHIAARNRGVWPHNGSVRIRMCEACAHDVIAADGEWAEVVS